MTSYREVTLVKVAPVGAPGLPGGRRFSYTYKSLPTGMAELRAFKRLKLEYPDEDWTQWHVMRPAEGT